MEGPFLVVVSEGGRGGSIDWLCVENTLEEAKERAVEHAEQNPDVEFWGIVKLADFGHNV